MSSNSSGNSLLCHAASKTLWGDFLTTFSAPSSPYSGGPFRGCSRIRGGGGKKAPTFKNLSHISYNDETLDTVIYLT